MTTLHWLALAVGAALGAGSVWYLMGRRLMSVRDKTTAVEEKLDKSRKEAAEFRRRAEEGKTTIKELRDVADRGKRALESLSESESAHAGELGGLRQALDLREKTIANLRGEVAEREEIAATLKSRLAKFEDSDAPPQQPSDVETRLAVMHRSLDQRNAAAERIEQELQAARKESDELRQELEGSRETNRRMNQRVTELKAAVNRLTESIAERNRRLGTLEQTLAGNGAAGSLVKSAPPKEGPDPEDEKHANARLVAAYKRDMNVKDTEIINLRKQISQRDRKISQLLDKDTTVDGPQGEPSPANGPMDSAPMDSGATDNGAMDGGATDNGATDSASADNGPMDLGQIDDLTRIKGIGPVFQARLHAAGIQTFAALAAAGPDELREIVEAKDYQAASIDGWLEQAREIAGN